MIVVRYSVEGFNAFQSKIVELEYEHDYLIVLFSASKGADGKSWCPDSKVALQVVNDVLDERAELVHFLHVGVGSRDYWEDENCKFRYLISVF